MHISSSRIVLLSAASHRGWVDHSPPYGAFIPCMAVIQTFGFAELVASFFNCGLKFNITDL